MKEADKMPPFGELRGVAISDRNYVFPDYVVSAEITLKTPRMRKKEVETGLPIRFLIEFLLGRGMSRKEAAHVIGIHVNTLGVWIRRLGVTQESIDSQSAS